MPAQLQSLLPPDHIPLVAVLLAVIAALLLSWAARRLVRRLGKSGHLSPVMAQRLQVGVRYGVLAVATLVVLQATGLFDNAWALLSAVIATVAIGFFAVWSLLSNATGALLILTFRPFRHGDRVELVEPTNGTVLGGAVLDINLMFTTLEERDPESGDRSILQIPNNLFFQKVVRTREAEPLSPAEEPFYRDSLTGLRAPSSPATPGSTDER